MVADRGVGPSRSELVRRDIGRDASIVQVLCLIVRRTNIADMDILAEVLDRVRLGGTLLFHFELGHPWGLALPARPYALFHYLSRGSATLVFEEGREFHMTEGDFVVVTRGEPHVFYSDRQAKP